MNHAPNYLSQPELFYRLDGNGKYTLPNEVLTDYGSAKALRKTCFDGDADVVVQGDTLSIYWKGDLVAQAQLYAEVETSPGVWQGDLFNFSDANINQISHRHITEPAHHAGGEQGPGVDVPRTPYYRAYQVVDYPAIGITNGVIGLDVHWAYKDTKFIFYLDAPGMNCRIRWQARVKDTAVAAQGGKGLQFSMKDYDGAYSKGVQADPEPGWTQHWWLIEPDGHLCDPPDARTPLERFEQKVGLYVDPYIYIDTQTTYVDIHADGYVLRILQSDTSSDSYEIWNSAITTKYSSGAFRFHDDSAGYDYYLGYDSNAMILIKDVSSGLTIIKLVGKLDRSSGATSNYLTNFTKAEIFFYCYEDRVAIQTTFTTSGTITADSGDYWHIIPITSVQANLTSEQNKRESSNSEVNASLSTAYNSATYFGFTSTELNIMLIKLYSSGWTFDQYSDSSHGNLSFRSTSTLSSGTYRLDALMVIDSAARSGSAQKYDATDRVNMAIDKQTDQTIGTPYRGDPVTDLLDPYLATVNYSTNDVFHYDYRAKTIMDINRFSMNQRIHRFPFLIGNKRNPTELVINHLLMNDNAASSTIKAIKGQDAQWRTGDPSSTRNTNNDSISSGNYFRDRALDQNDAGHFARLAIASGHHDNAYLKNGGLMFFCAPNHGYNPGTADYKPIMLLYYNDANYVNFYYSPDPDYCWIGWTYFGSTSYAYYLWTGNTPYTSDYEIQGESFMVTIGWNTNHGRGTMAVNGVTLSENSSHNTAASNDPIENEWGAFGDGFTPADYQMDEIITFSDIIQHFGAYHIGNGEGLLADIDNPHAGIGWYFDGQAAYAKGSTNLATDKNPTNNGGSFVTTDPLIGTNHWDSNGTTNNLTVAESGGDIINYSNGGVSMWIKLQAALSGGECLFDFYADANNWIKATFDSSYNLDVVYRSGGTTVTEVGQWTLDSNNFWQHIRVIWDDSFALQVYIDGIRVNFGSISTSWTGGNGHTLYFTEDHNGSNGLDCFIQNIYLLKDSGTPEIMSSMGRPLHVPQTYLNGVRQQYGS